MPPLSTVQSLPEGTLNLGDLNLHVAVPIVNKAGRGVPLTYTLGFDSDVWTPVTNSTWEPAFDWGWTTETDAFTGYVTYQTSPQQCAYGTSYPPQMYNFTLYENFIYYDQFGAAHLINMEPLQYPTGLPCGPNYPSSNSASAQDGSGLTLYASDNYGTPSATVAARSGAHISPPVYLAGSAAANGAGAFVDPNGNEITTNGSTFTDTLGVAELSVGGSGTPASPLTFSYPGPGGSETATVHYASQSVATGFTCNKNYSGTANLPTSVVLANGDTYDFGYGGAGRITSITLPTGATISYAYSGGSGGINCQDGSPSTLTRTVNGHTWTYVHSVGSNSVGTTTVTDPAGNVTTYTFYDDYEVERVVDQGSSSTLETVYTCYNSGAACTGPGGSFTLPITSRAVVTVLPDGQEDENVTDYDSYGDPLEIDNYDWSSSGAPTTILRKTFIDYASLSGIPDRPSEVQIANGSGTMVAYTDYSYDQTALQATSGLPQHTSAPNSSRGNLTTVQSCAVLSGSVCNRLLTSTYSYYDTGEVYQATAPNGAVTTYAYASSSPGCAGAFPTDVALPKDAQGNSYSLQYSWNCSGGVLASAMGENGNITSYAHNDPLWRLTGVSDPDGGGETISYLSPAETETSTQISSGLAKTQYALLDDLGRPSFSQTLDGTPCDTVQTTYDSATDSVQVSQPYSTTCQSPGSGAEFTTTVFDALGRPGTATAPNSAVTSYAYTGPAVTVTGPAPGDVSHILQANGLGELAEVCEITSASGSGACGTAAGGTGYLTTYSYDALGGLTGVDEAGQTRSFSYDALGRVTAETTPESGTTDFTYDTDSTCGTANGALVKRVDAIGNVTCYGYDALGRVTSITYPSGSYASVTPAKTFVFDAATVNGQAMGNAAGRLAEAYTGPSSAKITDEGFGYDVMGRPAQFFESTPNSGGYYQTQETYYQDGQRDTLTLPWTPVLTYGVNAVGEVTSVDAASGQNPVTTASYNPAGQLLGLTFGSGDSDGYGYSSTTGLMTQYQFTVNGATDTGALSWNADGTLGSLQITDSIPGTNDSQSCSYGYDSLGRIASVDCPNVWSQSFTYDAYGNVKKSGSLNWQPNYNGNNQANIGYDLDGNVTNDGANTYAWDAAGKMITVNSDQATYDALGRLAQESANSSLRLYYAPDGALAGEDNACCGIREQYAGLPGGAEAVFDCCNLYYYRDGDWLGSERLAAWTNQTLVSEEAYAPFGEAYAGAGAGEQMFTGKGQRLAAGIYDFPFRHYSPAQGRWLSPDPSGLAAVNPANPQSWNAYAYVANQPLTATDPLGLGTITFKTVVSECITCVGVWQPSPWNLLSPTYWDFMDASMQPPTFQAPSKQTGGSASRGSAATAAAPATAAAQCPRGAGLALPVAASAEGGLGVTGAGARTGALLGAFDSGAGGPSAGALQTGGAAAYFLGHSSGAPAQAGHQPLILGAFAGITVVGGTLTNAGSPSQLAGPFLSRTLNIGFGPQVTIQYASSPSGIWEFSISVGPGAGVDYSQYQTNTALRAGGGC